MTPRGGEDGRPDLHIFSECFDDTVWLELRQGPVTVTFQIPQEAMAAMLASETCAAYAEHGADSSWMDCLPDLTKCPSCGGPADNGHDREFPPNVYACTKCSSKLGEGAALINES